MKALQIPVTLYIHVTTYPLAEGFYVSTSDMSSFRGNVLIETRQIFIDVNQPEPIDIIGKQVEALQAQKANLTQATYHQIATIDDQIQQLLCIEHCPVTVDELPY
ncbi:hypothetical protein KGP26_10450 [Serratia sp. JSRIV002]|uniref:hypothetical protein n=1 Tax=Serratia sp. JSRIV002 TaxID=2831894 RepID=UPI001CBDF39B|nr:hypothetical protein [Serratia sp. JSRIV002]UAN53442.1 hypothetical protein KGP26_10450 [Serratia sp. JSRIV002]